MKRQTATALAILTLAAALTALCAPAARAQWAPPPPEKRLPLDVAAVMIYAAHENDRPTLIACVDQDSFYREYLARAKDKNPMTETEFRAGLLFALTNSSSDKLDQALKGLEGRDKYRFIMMFLKSYSEVKTEGDTRRIIVRAEDEQGRQPEIFLRRGDGVWRVVWVEPFDRLREFFGQQPAEDAAQQSAAGAEQKTPAGPETPPVPALDLPPAKRSPAQALAVLIIGADRKDWDLAASAFDIAGMRNMLVRDMPALDFLPTEKIREIFLKILARGGQKISAFLPSELNRLNAAEKAEMVELMVRALSTTVISGTSARITVRHPGDESKSWEYKMNKTADGWKIDVLSVFDNLIEQFTGQLNRK